MLAQAYCLVNKQAEVDHFYPMAMDPSAVAAATLAGHAGLTGQPAAKVDKAWGVFGEEVGVTGVTVHIGRYCKYR